MSIEVTINQKGIRIKTVKDIIEKAVWEKYPSATITVKRKEPAITRSDRFAEAQSMASDAKCDAEGLRDELQEWKENLPENLQDGSKADEIQEAIDALEEFIDSLDIAEGACPEFPGMY